MSEKIPAGWAEDDNHLVREIQQKDFVTAVEFVNKIVPLAEDAGHHPDISIFGYKNIRVSMTTHDAGGKVTEKDYRLAERINQLL